MALMSTPFRYYSRFVFEQTITCSTGVTAAASPRLARPAAARLEYPPTMTGYTQQFSPE